MIHRKAVPPSITKMYYLQKDLTPVPLVMSVMPPPRISKCETGQRQQLDQCDRYKVHFLADSKPHVARNLILTTVRNNYQKSFIRYFMYCHFSGINVHPVALAVMLRHGRQSAG